MTRSRFTELNFISFVITFK